MGLHLSSKMPDLETQPNWKDDYFDRQVGRLKVLSGVIVGIFLAGIATVLWGDIRYVRRTDFDQHAETQRQLEAHILEDSRGYATKQMLSAHESLPGHPSSSEINQNQEIRIAQLEKSHKQLERNQEWMANAIYRLALRNGIPLSPPPLKSE